MRPNAEWSSRSSTERQAFLSVAFLVVIVASLLALTWVGFETISAARAYVGGEGLWSKAQKDAVHHLVRYAYRRNPADHTAFLTDLSIPLGDRQARLELERDRPDYSLVRQGFLDGRNHPDDVQRMSTFFRRFRHVSFVDRAIGIWARGDSLIVLLAATGDQLHAEISSGPARQERIDAHLQDIEQLNADISVLEYAFSETMGEGARWAASVLSRAIVAAAVVLLTLASYLTWRTVRRLKESEASLHVSEAQLRQAQKMEAVGQLTGGIAHDFNNLLTVILSTADLMEAELGANEAQAREDLTSLRQAAERGAVMIRKLLAFSRERQLQFRPQRLGDLVKDAVVMLRRVMPEHIELEVESASGTPTVRTDPAAVEQILLNLGTNARDAMPGGGVLRIATGRIDLEERRATELGLSSAGRYAVVRVTDNGTGMDPGVRERLFEPFFTTKPPGQGSGLGASMVYGLVRQHRGGVEVESARGAGTSITLYFPAVMELPVAAAPGGPAPMGRNEMVLLVEDEAPVRAATKRVLERQGYRVLEATNGEQALTLLQSHAEPIGLVLTDVVMPRMNGTALYEATRSNGSSVPFLFLSGYTERDIGAQVALPPGAVFVAKPWTIQELMQALRRALDPSTASEASPAGPPAT